MATKKSGGRPPPAIYEANFIALEKVDNKSNRCCEVARVQIEEIARLKPRKRLTMLMDGWEDRLKRSLYGMMVTEVKQSPVVLALQDMTGHRGTASNLVEASQMALKTMEIEDGKNLIALTTDNPTVMQAFRRKFQEKFFWVLTFACFLHQLNTMIGDICSYPPMKAIISQTTRIVNFFNNSHYWGGQVNDEAKSQNIKRKMKQNCESRWYALILQGLSVQAYRPEAQKKTNGQTPVAADVVRTVLYDLKYWTLLNQLTRTTKLIYDAIGNLESRDATLADCMLELIRCARTMSQLERDPDEDEGFWLHAKTVFRQRFHAMNTDIHSLALFLHPSCRKLAIQQVANGRSFDRLLKIALDIAKRWRWSEAKAKKLIDDMKQYHLCRAPFAGGQPDGLTWWEGLTVSAEEHPLKALAIVLFSIVPHAAEVERLFSDLGGTQSIKRCNLAVNTFESLGKLRSNYTYHLHQKALAAGKPIRRRHAHMHTQKGPGINTNLATDLEINFAWVPPLTAEVEAVDDNLEGPEAISLDEIDEAFAQLEREKIEMAAELGAVAEDVLSGAVYDFAELTRVDQGMLPQGLDDEVVSVVQDSDNNGGAWDIDALMSSEGL
ncbi:hypothetical protein BV22DRAFT_1107611 [Leucogyrophana mollusca]|uniref:Uncharacterized protein n=1 Tax=Leucogyrophana mollusca TaxID=85980 RepID=A0ACB8B568_9AGAM|nr:hypothetical protein BV22DRAFT_1107611 [Leucogyrophana mollusca]